MTSPGPTGPYPQLPAGFRFGTASAAFQVEGALDADGRTPSVWDTFTAEPGRVVDGTDASRACEHYRRSAEDVALMRGLGTDSYRFSISWSRVVPHADGKVNEAGLDFYDRLVDQLLEAGQAPMATLFHWDLPQYLEDDGGWLNRATVDRFAEYARIVGDRLADRVEHWVPVNEPVMVTMLGYGEGSHAPGKQLMFDAIGVAHHLLLGHGRAVAELRASGARSVGCANHHAPIWPASEDELDTGVSKLFDALWNGLFMEPMLLGRYPADVAGLLTKFVAPGDMATIRQPLDFYGVNYYQPMKVAAAAEDAPLPWEMREVLGYPTTDFGWPVVPEALREWLIITRARFRAAIPPLVITESGCSYATGPGADGVVDDQARIDYHDAHLRAIAAAVERGVDVQGYYAWSLTDNFEWAEGLSQRFGLVHVDFDTQVRTPKRSYDWYRDMIASQEARGS